MLFGGCGSDLGFFVDLGLDYFVGDWLVVVFVVD